MASVPPPQGMNEIDYEAIEAAVTETVRGRWFLNEFARRNRATEMRQLLDAMARLEGAVGQGQAALPPADPSIRLLMQRIKEIAGQLDQLSSDMRAAGLDDRFADAVTEQARAVSGMIRSATATKPALPPAPSASPAPSAPPRSAAAPPPAATARLPRADLPPGFSPSRPQPVQPEPASAVAAGTAAPRLAVLSGFDGLTLAKKLAVFR